MRTFARLIFVVAIATLLGLASSPAQAEQSLELAGTSSKQSYRHGEPIRLDATVTNKSGKACQLSAVPDGALTVTGVVKDGRPVQPSLSIVSYEEGLAGNVLGNLAPAEPGAPARFTVPTGTRGRNGEHQGLVSVAYSPAEQNIRSLFPVDSPGEYTVSLSYAMPNVPGAPKEICRGASNTIGIRFTIAEDSSASFWQRYGWYIAGVVLAAVLVALWLLWRRRRGQRGPSATASVLCVALATSALLVANGRPAHASVEFAPGSTMAFQMRVWSCIYQIEAAGPAVDPLRIIPVIKSTDHPVVFIEAPIGSSNTIAFNPPRASDGAGTGSEVRWSWENREPYQDGTPRDECSPLFHELYHAYEHAKGTSDYAECKPGSNVSTAEVNATNYQNRWRNHVNIAPRTQHHPGSTLPNSNECEKRPRKKRRPPDNPAFDEAECVGKSCGSSNGDPHLTTFDGLSYDFQAVGEFVAVKSASDLEIQTRQAAFPGATDVSVNSAIAMNVAGDRVGIYANDDVVEARVNGTALAEGSTTLALPKGGSITRGNAELGPVFKVVWPDSSTAWVSSVGRWGVKIDTFLAPARRGSATGLLGNFDGNRDNDLVTRQGAAIASPPTFEALYPAFADSRRISQAESLFDYATGQTTDTFTDRTLPRQPVTITDRESAETICRLAGITTAPHLDNCVLDVGLTGQSDFVESAASSESAYTRPGDDPQPSPVDPGGTVKDGDVVKGRIDAPGERDVYQLDLGDATEFQFVEQTGDISIEPETPGLWKRALTTDADEIAENSPQAKRFVVSKSDNTTGEYSLRVVTHKHRRLDVKMGDRIDGRLDVPGRVDIYALDPGSAGSIELTGVQGCYYWVGVAEDAPDSTVTTPYPVWPEVLGQKGPPCSSIPIPVEPNKRFLLAVWFPEGKPLDYGFRIEAR